MAAEHLGRCCSIARTATGGRDTSLWRGNVVTDLRAQLLEATLQTDSPTCAIGTPEVVL